MNNSQKGNEDKSPRNDFACTSIIANKQAEPDEQVGLELVAIVRQWAKHFREELDTGAAKANTRVAEFLFEQATGQRGDGSAAVTAAIFWLKTRARWKE